MQPRSLNVLICSTEVPPSEISRGGGFNLDECMSIHFVLDKFSLSSLSVIQLLQLVSADIRVDLICCTDVPVV